LIKKLRFTFTFTQVMNHSTLNKSACHGSGSPKQTRWCNGWTKLVICLRP